MLYDDDLNPVLEQASAEDLEPLVKCISSAITNSLTSHERYKQHFPDHTKYREIIAQEIRSFGGNTFANLMRSGEGPSYKSIVEDVLKLFDVPLHLVQGSSISDLEQALIAHYARLSIEKMSPEDRLALLDSLQIDAGQIELFELICRSEHYQELFINPTLNRVISIVILSTLARSLGMGVITAVLGSTLGLAVGRALGILGGPIGWTLAAAYTVFDLAGPAKRVVVPCVLYIALLRLKQNSRLAIMSDLTQESFHFPKDVDSKDNKASKFKEYKEAKIVVEAESELLDDDDKDTKATSSNDSSK